MVQLFFLFLFTVSPFAYGQMPAKDFNPKQVRFAYMTADGSTWTDCEYKRGEQPHAWVVTCGASVFKLHLFMVEYPRATETTVEFHYWADEQVNLFETHTQSTWVTLDQKAKTKSVVSYLGFKQDSTQLRFELDLRSPVSSFRK